MRYRIGSFLTILITLAALGCGRSALAFGYVINDADWATWPEYCKVKYTMTPIGRNTRGQYPAEARERWRRSIGPVWDGLHHYCVGMIYVHQAQGAAEPKAKQRYSYKAEHEIAYSYRGLGAGSPLFSTISAYYALALHGVGKTETAMQVLDKAIQIQPESPESYVVKAQIERKAGKLDEAEKVLLSFSKNGGRNSAEIDYHLAFVYLEKNDYKNARIYTKSALQKGYPLTGLKRKLERLGEWR
jgi:tetratricopeptide (TPR) repeat protein